jgi:hypothetical protein
MLPGLLSLLFFGRVASSYDYALPYVFFSQQLLPETPNHRQTEMMRSKYCWRC